MKKIKITQIPNTAKDLYVQLYCEKRGGETSECIHNATQSWLSLSLTKKSHFYKTLSKKSVLKKAQRIIKTKPFLKPKSPHNPKRRLTVHDNGSQQNDDPGPEPSTSDNDLPTQYDKMECDSTDKSLETSHCENNIDGSPPGSNNLGPESPTESNNLGPVSPALEETEVEYGSEETRNEPHVSEAPENTTCISVIDEDTNTTIENNTNEKQAEQSMPTEPIVPIIKNGKELYALLCSRKGTNNVAYESLTAREKRLYGHAACRIKKEFVTHYKAYLESLTSKQLFDYYTKMF